MAGFDFVRSAKGCDAMAIITGQWEMNNGIKLYLTASSATERATSLIDERQLPITTRAAAMNGPIDA